MGTTTFQPPSGNTVVASSSRRFSREGRLIGVLIAIAVMAYADLDMTLAYATSVGMGEGNPVARAVMGIQSTMAVVSFKALCTLVGIAILYRARQSRTCEPAAWIVLAVMAWLMVRWHNYTTGIAETPSLYVDAASHRSVYADEHPEWVNMTP